MMDFLFIDGGMKAVIQRVSQASVSINGQQYSAIGKGVLVLLGIEDADTSEDIEWLCNKMVALRIFNDADGVMNLSLKDINGELLLVSQFTLHAAVKKAIVHRIYKRQSPKLLYLCTRKQ